MIDITNFTSSTPDNFDINLLQKEVDGGAVSVNQINECLEANPTAKTIIISGLKQEEFDYFIQTYGSRFEAISFWKNKAVVDLSALGKLSRVKYINYFFNQKATSLWDMSGNTALEGVGIYDFSKLHSIKEIETAPNLRFFGIGDMVWAGMEIESLKPVANTGITHLEWCGKKVADGDFACLANGKIETLDLNPTQFTIEELTDLLALFPRDLKGSITKPYVSGSVSYKGKDEAERYYFLCKNKKKCVAGKDDERFAKYLKEFEEMLEQKRAGLGNN